MNLERHLQVLWRFRFITAAGLLFGIALALLAAFKVGPGGLERRGSEQWSSTSNVMVTQKGFPWGRVTLPNSAALGQGQTQGATATPTPSGGDDSRIPFADPGRFSTLALLYSVISYSDQVRKQLPGHPLPSQIVVQPVDPTGRGDNFLPILQITTTADTPKAAFALNQGELKGMRNVLVSEQDRNSIPDKDRVLLNVLNEPSDPALVAGRSKTAPMLAFVLAIMGTFAFVHILEAIRLSRLRRQQALAAASASFNGNGHVDPDEAAEFVAEHVGAGAPYDRS